METPLPTCAIVTENLVRRYPGASVPALQSLNLEVKTGEIFGLLGPNGAGKTTLISVLCTLQPFDSGSAEVWGYAMARNSSRIRPCIGLVPQDIALYPTLTAWENLKYFGEIQRIPKAKLKSRLEECLAMVGLSEVKNQKISEYSGGMKRRINLAAGILHEPKILFLDEPTVGVDPQSRTLIFRQIRELRRTGMTIVYTTHYMEEAQQLCDRVAIMDHGKILAQDSPQALVANQPGCDNLEDLFIALTGSQLRD